MTSSQPGAPAQPQAPAAPSARTEVPEDLTKQLDDANKAVEEATRRANARAAGVGTQGRPGSVSVVKNGAGNVVVTTGDGRVVTIDPKAGLDEDAIQNLVQTALAPPRFPPQPWESRTPVAIVAIVFTFLFLMVAMILAFRSRGRGMRAAAGVGAQQLPPDLAPRLARIEQAIEAVAIEVERISESERYSARLLTERLPAANGQPAATPTADVVR